MRMHQYDGQVIRRVLAGMVTDRIVCARIPVSGMVGDFSIPTGRTSLPAGVSST